MPQRRHLAAFVLLGAFINVLTSWALAAWAPLGPGAISPVPPGSTPAAVPSPPLLWEAPVSSAWPAPTSVIAARGPGIAAQLASAPGNSSAAVIQSGLPWLSMRTVLLTTSDPAAGKPAWFRAGIELPHRFIELSAEWSRTVGTIGVPDQGAVPQVVTTKRSTTIPRRLPVEPLWPAFLANTLVFAAVAASAWNLLLASRRFLRRRAARCPTCAYPRAGLDPQTPCPECGTRTT